MSNLDTVAVQAGTMLFHEGEVGHCAYLIKSGRIEIFLAREDRDIVLATRGIGEIVGEMAVIDNRPRSASARVVEDGELVLVSSGQIADRITETDPILRMCLGVVLRRYRETISRLDGSRERAGARTENQSFEAALGTLSLESELRRALARDELELHYQPIVRLPSRRLVGFEALLRWHHPQHGLIPPAEFVPVAEASGLITEISRWCLAQVGRSFGQVMQAAPHNPHCVDPLFVSVNISGRDATRPLFAATVETMLRESGLDARALKLEVTESMLMKDPASAAATLRACRDLGVEIAVDDFGTGYSSLSHLSTLPIDTIKIDRSFVRSMAAEPASRKIIQMILRLAEELELPVVAEGIETAREEAILSDLGCTFGQGYLFARPAPLHETVALARNWRSRERIRSSGQGARGRARPAA